MTPTQKAERTMLDVIELGVRAVAGLIAEQTKSGAQDTLTYANATDAGLHEIADIPGEDTYALDEPTCGCEGDPCWGSSQGLPCGSAPWDQ